MELVPDLELGWWNAWIIVVAHLVASFAPFAFGGKKAEARMQNEPEFHEFSLRTRAAMFLDHLALMPLTLVYSFFVPLEPASLWLFAGLLLAAVAVGMGLAASIAFTTAPVDRPMTHGVYAISRHPMYVSGIITYLSVGLAGTSWVFLACAAVDAIAWQIVIPEEERTMIAKYGDAYRDYMSRTPRWIGWPKAASAVTVGRGH